MCKNLNRLYKSNVGRILVLQFEQQKKIKKKER